MTAAPALGDGSDPVHDRQQVFRAVMNALARPGSLHRIAWLPAAPKLLSPAMAAVTLMLADHETPIWLDEPLLQAGDPAAYIRFHTGARIVSQPEQATFALISAPLAMPSLDQFSQGTLEFPDRSATLILQLEVLSTTAGWSLSGPGIATHTMFQAKPLPEDFPARMAANRIRYPRGVDLLLLAGDIIAGLPRTTSLAG